MSPANGKSRGVPFFRAILGICRASGSGGGAFPPRGNFTSCSTCEDVYATPTRSQHLKQQSEEVNVRASWGTFQPHRVKIRQGRR